MHSLRIGNDSAKTRADRVQYYIHVPSSSSSFNIQCEFAVVVEDGGHNADEQATFQVVAYDSASGTVLPAANNLYIAHFAVPGFLTDRSPTPFYLPDVYYLPWTASTVNLSGMGGKTVILECTALDCMYGGHMGYGYFDVTGVADSLMASIISYNSVGDSVLLQGPPGYKTYQWYNQDFSLVLNNATDTERIKSVLTPPSPQYYNLIVTPYASIGLPDTIRTPLLKAHNLSVSSPLLSLASVYPNPVGAVMHVQFKTPFSGMLSVLNYGGETVFSENLAGKASFHIATTAFANGYL